ELVGLGDRGVVRAFGEPEILGRQCDRVGDRRRGLQRGGGGDRDGGEQDGGGSTTSHTQTVGGCRPGLRLVCEKLSYVRGAFTDSEEAALPVRVPARKIEGPGVRRATARGNEALGARVCTRPSGRLSGSRTSPVTFRRVCEQR